MIAATHPLFGRLLEAASFKRVSGVEHLVVGLPDGTPGTIPAAATSVFGDMPAADDAGTVLTVEGIRQLADAGRGAVAAYAIRPATHIGSPHPNPHQRNREVSLLRSLRIAVPTQLALDVDPRPDLSGQRWAELPPAARERVLVLLARLIAHDVLAAGKDGL